MASDVGGEVAELLQQMIRNACVNDGTPESGHEKRNADVLRDRARGPRPRHGGLRAPARAHLPGGPDRGPRPGRARAWRCSGTPTSSPPTATTGATTPSAASSSTARCGAGARSTCSTSRPRWRWPSATWPTTDSAPRATSCSSGWPTRRRSAPTAPSGSPSTCADEVRADYLITEAGGFPMASPDGVRLPVITGEKGAFWCTLTVRGTPGHASQPLRTDNALVKAAEVVRRLAEHETARRHPRRLAPLRRGHRPPRRLHRAAARPRPHRRLLRDPPRPRPRPPGPCLHPHHHGPHRHAGGHQGERHPRPGRASQVDIRTLPGWDRPEVEAMLDDALGDLAGDVEVDVELHRRRHHVPDRHPVVGRARARGPACRIPTPAACPS